MVTNNSTNTSSPVSVTQGGTGLSSTTTQQVLYSSGANTIAGLAIPATPGQFLRSDGTNFGYFNPLQEVLLYDDFIAIVNGSICGNTGFVDVISGTGSKMNNSVNGDNSHPGTIEPETGTTTTGAALIRLGANNTTAWAFTLGGGALTCIWVVKIITLSDGTDTYAFRCGLMNVNTAAAVGSGVYFEYTDTGSSPAWSICTSAATVRTVTQSSTNVVAGTWYTLRMDINAAGTSVAYSINGSTVSAGPITTNIPTAQIGPCAYMLKSAGTNSRIAVIDYFYLYQKLTSAR